MDFIISWHDGMYWTKAFLAAIPKQEHDFVVKITKVEFFYKCKSVCLFHDKDS